MIKQLTIVFYLFSAFAYGQTIYEHDLDEGKLNELKQDIRHLSPKPERWTYDNEKEYQEAVRKTEGGAVKQATKKEGYQSPEKIEERQWDSYDFDTTNMNLGPLGQVILYVILGGALVALIYFLFINSNFKRNGAKFIPLDIEEVAPSDIPKTELEKQLHAALANQNYRKAVRIYYLFILKDLSERNWIQWEKQKTNMHYILEMQSKSEVESFSKAVTYFEFIWYGKRNISEEQFKIVQPQFTDLLHKLDIK